MLNRDRNGRIDRSVWALLVASGAAAGFCLAGCNGHDHDDDEVHIHESPERVEHVHIDDDPDVDIEVNDR